MGRHFTPPQTPPDEPAFMAELRQLNAVIAHNSSTVAFQVKRFQRMVHWSVVVGFGSSMIGFWAGIGVFWLLTGSLPK